MKRAAGDMRRGGIDLVVGDGGFMAARDQHDQESLLTGLFTAEVLVALQVIHSLVLASSLSGFPGN